MLVREHRDSLGLTSKEYAQLLSEKTGRPVTDRRVSAELKRELPKPWAAAFGLDASDGGDSDPTSESPVETGRPPRMPEGAPRAPLPAVASSVAKERLTELYGLVGFMGTRISGHEGVKVVSDDYAPHIADAWLKAAEENEFARRVVRLVSAGGAVGELVTVHVIWLLAILYVTGRTDDPTGLLARKYERFHADAVARARLEAEGESVVVDAAANGHGAEGAADAVAGARDAAAD